MSNPAAPQNSPLETDQAIPEPKTDHMLINEYKSGNQLAFQELVQKYESRVYNHCLRMINNGEEAEDLAQEVFFKVYRNIASYEHTYSFYTWLYRITVNCCIDFMRKRKRQFISVSLSRDATGDISNTGKEHDIPDKTFEPEQLLEHRELTEMMQKAIDQLSDKLRVIIVLKEIDGLSYEEIAEILNCSRGTVKSRLFRARERLKELLSPYMHKGTLKAESSEQG